MLSEKALKEAADLLGVDVATIQAVDEVESGGKGFFKTGEPIILFEPHVFWRELRNIGLIPAEYQKGNEDILYPQWGTRPYGKSTDQHKRLARAVKINRIAALKSASWGRFQILGTNYKICGYGTLQEFINAMYHSEDDHLKAFVGFVKGNHLDTYLRAKDWESFAKHYNGRDYKKNKYDTKLAEAYQKHLNG